MRSAESATDQASSSSASRLTAMHCSTSTAAQLRKPSGMGSPNSSPSGACMA
jgi:hypothetical protein